MLEKLKKGGLYSVVSDNSGISYVYHVWWDKKQECFWVTRDRQDGRHFPTAQDAEQYLLSKIGKVVV